MVDHSPVGMCRGEETEWVVLKQKENHSAAHPSPSVSGGKEGGDGFCGMIREE